MFFVMKLAILVLLLVLVVSYAQKRNPSPSSNRRIDEKVKNLDDGPRRRILAMQKAGFPKDVIAKKIAYEAGNEGTAKRMLEKINVEEEKKKWAHQQKQKTHVLKNVKKQKKEAKRKLTSKTSKSKIKAKRRA